MTQLNRALEKSIFLTIFFAANLLYSYLDSNRCLATREDDREWSIFVFWIVEAIVYAEANGIHRESSNEMPTVALYGIQFERMFRDAIGTVGNYGDIYVRNVEKFIPRTGLNGLFNMKHPEPLLEYVPGIFQ